MWNHELSSNDRGISKTSVIPLLSKSKSQILVSFSQPGSISTWVGLAEAFYRKFYSKQKTATIHQALHTFFTYFERFKDLLLECPHHGFKKIRLIQILYEGLDYSNKTMIESLCNGTFTSKTADDAWQFFEEVAENTLEWEPVSVDNKQLTTSTVTNKGGIHKVNPNFESDAKLTSVVRRLEALELSKGATIFSSRNIQASGVSRLCPL